MNTIGVTTSRVYKAQNTPGSSPIAGVKIVIETPAPDVKSLGELAKVYEEDAITLAKALIGNLPGGTLIRLTALLLKHQAEKTFFIVRDGD